MDDNTQKEDKICPNCKREIPADNFTIHTVHCARNIRLCPVCKEPVPQAELQEHHEKFHKMLPCKKCGESVCGTDLEDHIRDSCALTVKSCRYCELELPRRELPPHEAYCGVRTEQCPDCREWVMIKYRQLHLDSNHGFIRLDDDPEPSSSVTKPIKDPSKPFARISQVKPVSVIKKVNNQEASTSRLNQTTSNLSNVKPGCSGVSRPSPSVNIQDSSSTSVSRPILNGPSPSSTRQVTLPKRTNDQPQINTAVEAVDKIKKELPASRGATKKRPAPKPPAPAGADPKRDLPYYKALARQQREEKERQEQTAYNLSVGLPPVLSAAAKVEKLRKMDALHNREVEDLDYRNRLQDRVWGSPDSDVPVGNVLGTSRNTLQEHQIRERNLDIPDSTENIQENLRNATRTALISQNSDQEDRRNRQNIQEVSRTVNTLDNPNMSQSERRRNDFSNLKPMTPEEFMDRFRELQVHNEWRRPRGEGRGERRTERVVNDRFSEIKSSLRELRRGLNEVTAPYNFNSNSNSNENATRSSSRSPARRTSPAQQAAPEQAPEQAQALAHAADDTEVRLPCEFCAEPIPAQDLVQHQTGCRPDLTQYRPRSASPSSPPSTPPAHELPLIPCEFCMQALPVYLVSEHQERCRRDNNLLYAD